MSPWRAAAIGEDAHSVLSAITGRSGIGKACHWSGFSTPEAAGLRHLAFEVDDLSVAIDELDNKGIAHDPIRTDEYTGKRFVFFSDPDGLPIELYEK